VPSDQESPRIPPEALDAFLDGILSELRSPADNSALDEVRAAFRRRVPLHLRSYAAAIMILRAAGHSRGAAKPPQKEVSQKPSVKGKREEAPKKKDAEAIRKPAPKDRPAAQAKDEAKAKNGSDRSDTAPRPRYEGEGATLFFSIGKRQRFYPRSLIDLLMEEAGLALTEIGEIRPFDNYTFADIDPAKAADVVAALNGKEVRGRRLAVNPAKKRDEEELPD
jgi:hypothetical protein